MPLGIELLIALLIGGIFGFFCGWLKWGGKKSDSRLENVLQEQIKQRESELEKLRGQFSEAGNARAAAEAKQSSAEKLLVEQKNLQEKALANLRDTFKALSADALKQSAPEFLRLAEQSFGKFQETAKGDLAQRQEAIKTLVEPLKQQLEVYQKRLRDAETSQADTLGKVKEQLASLAASSQSLATETSQFRSVLKSNQARGRWGEETLRRVVEAAGMSAHCDFIEQSKGEEGKPDLIVRLPGNRAVIVDSKMPDLEFLNAADAAEPLKRAELVAAHAAKLRATIKDLSERNYPRQFSDALDHVVIFLPAESLFSTALEGDPDLIVWAESKQVYLATPASFIAILRTINFIWQQHKQTENSQKIAEAARELFTRVCVFTEHFQRIGEGLSKANEAFNKAAASYQSRIRPAGEKLTELGGTTPEKELADVQPLDSTLRLPS